MMDKQVKQRAVARKTARNALGASCHALAIAVALALGSVPGAAGAQTAPVQISITAQPLGDALIQLGEQASLVIFYLPETVRGRNAPAVMGRLTPDEALRNLLAGTGIVFQRDGRNVSLSTQSAGASVLEPVTVRGVAVGTADSYVALSSASGKLNVPLIETPRSVSIVTQEQIKAQAPRSLEAALAYTPGVQTEVSGSSDVRMVGAVIRGFSDGSAYYKDGLKMLSAGTYGSWNDNLEDLDSIEVLKGPASVLFGQGRPGGVINVVSKRPAPDQVNSVGISYGTYNRRQVTADLGGAFDENDKVLYRLNVTGRKSDGRTDGSRDDRISVAPTVLWNITNQTRVTVLGTYSKERGTPKSWWPNLYTYPEIADLPMHRTAGDPDFDRFDRDTKSIGYAFEHDTDNGWRLRQNLRYSEIDIDYRHIYAMDLLADKRTVTRGSLAQRTHGQTLAVDNRASKDFVWGDVQHTFAMGVDYLRYQEHDALGYGWDVPNLDIYAPVYGQHVDYPELDKSQTDLKQTGIYTLNQLKFGRWVGNVSLRRDFVTTTRSSVTQPKSKDAATTGSAGLLYLFDNGIAPYISYSTAFDPITGQQFDGSSFKPREGKQYEAGVKYQPPGTDALFTAAVFDIRQKNVTTQDPDHPRFSVQTGEVRSTGLELEAKFPLTRELRLMAGYTYLNPRTTQSNRPAEVGRQTSQTARQTASLWVDYRPHQIQGLMLGGGVRYRGKSPLNTAADGTTPYNPAFTLADLAVAYETPRYRIALNINNVFDKRYYTYTFRGMERETMLSLNYYW
ncbi:TonB-dependent siderophore receptor [Achromobacter seleniivolatilans]|uniref:TonB-dependent siderophore receptor n=1 Tax=Achromobacter seleniivolatilans TaxID=3047478 RepID=A0ABY9M0S7_9BURK|nr:TonB-dependent siderophore receptor [Achromobacter sp. R39]WMD20335.1 TonB-dependent siderophore receptor [Achromobacter sp. R39]